MPWLEWLDRKKDVGAAGKAPYRLLEPVTKHDYGDMDSGNMLIQGDNLDALKALIPYYAGQIKSIYIDPPFNTGAAFDNYDDNLKNSVWLSLMFRRLEQLRLLLREDGSIFVHLDDNQLDYAKVMLDELFGRSNFIGRITIDVRAPSAFSTVNSGVFKASEYLLWYAKDKRQFKEFGERIPRELDYAYDVWIDNPEEDYSKWTFSNLVNAYESSPPPPARTRHPASKLKHFEKFVLKNAHRICRLAEISDSGAGEAIVNLKTKSLRARGKLLRLQRDGELDDVYVIDGQQLIFYSKNVREIDGKLQPSQLLTNIWSDISWEGIANEGGVKFKKGKKPEKLLKRCLSLTTTPGDLVLDSFLGSGTTAAVAHKMGRRWIGIELLDQAETHCLPRMRGVVDGEQSGISKIVKWRGGGGFRFFRLGPPIFDEDGHIREGIRFEHLAAHVWFAETGTARSTRAKKSPLLGVHQGTAYYLLFNGVLGDKRPNGGNVLTLKLLGELPPHEGPKVIYGESTGLSAERLKALGVTFKQTPYDIKAR